jgi:hypothetical protein
MVLRGLEKVIDVQKMTEEKRSTLKAWQMPVTNAVVHVTFGAWFFCHVNHMTWQKKMGLEGHMTTLLRQVIATCCSSTHSSVKLLEASSAYAPHYGLWLLTIWMC